MTLTDDPNDPRLTHGADPLGSPYHEQADVYLVLSEAERAQSFIRPVRRTYVHDVCGGATTMGLALAETYARDPKFYGATYCCVCGQHRPVGVDGEFTWSGTTEKVGS